jgi:hypothetical protein
LAEQTLALHAPVMMSTWTRSAGRLTQRSSQVTGMPCALCSTPICTGRTAPAEPFAAGARCWPCFSELRRLQGRPGPSNCGTARYTAGAPDGPPSAAGADGHDIAAWALRIAVRHPQTLPDVPTPKSRKFDGRPVGTTSASSTTRSPPLVKMSTCTSPCSIAVKPTPSAEWVVLSTPRHDSRDEGGPCCNAGALQVDDLKTCPPGRLTRTAIRSPTFNDWVVRGDSGNERPATRASWQIRAHRQDRPVSTPCTARGTSGRLQAIMIT